MRSTPAMTICTRSNSSDHERATRYRVEAQPRVAAELPVRRYERCLGTSADGASNIPVFGKTGCFGLGSRRNCRAHSGPEASKGGRYGASEGPGRRCGC